jgi:simple sugar transport system permease protein
VRAAAQAARPAAPVLGVLAALLIGALLLALAGIDPLMAYGVMLRGAFGGSRQVQETILKAVPLALVGLGLSVSLRARMWNIGGEGQYFIGALFSTMVAVTFPGWPAWLLVPAVLAGGLLGGGLWAAIPAWLRTRRGMNEIISTLMLNYIAVLLVEYLVRGPLQDPASYLPESAQFAPAARMPALIGRLHLGVFIALALVPLCYLLIWRTPLGFKLRAVGSRARVARTAGIDPAASIAFALIFSGALAGLAGLIEVSYLHTRLKGQLISGGYGFSGILVALISRLNPFAVVIVAIFFAALTIGMDAMHSLAQVPATLADALQALVVLLVLGADALARRGE